MCVLVFSVKMEANGQSLLSQFSQYCGACCEDRRGHQCVRFDGCHHVFCMDCMRQYFRFQICERRPQRCGCLAPDCPSTASLGLLRDLLSEEEVLRYKNLQREVEYGYDVVSAAFGAHSVLLRRAIKHAVEAHVAGVRGSAVSAQHFEPDEMGTLVNRLMTVSIVEEGGAP
jgi:hypothetical protein